MNMKHKNFDLHQAVNETYILEQVKHIYILDFFDIIFDFARSAKKNFFAVFDILDFLTFLTFHFGARNQALEAQGTQGGAVPPRNPGRAQARTAHR